HCLAVVQEEILDGVGLVTEREDELLVPMMGIILHRVPDNWPWANRRHGFRDCFREVTQAKTLAATKNNDFHLRSLQPSAERYETQKRVSRLYLYAGCRPYNLNSIIA